MNDAVRAAIMALATSALNMLVLLRIVELDGDQLGGINLFIGNLVLVIALVWKTGQGKAPLPASMVVGEDPAQSAIRKASE
jgi:hypothetical protein